MIQTFRDCLRSDSEKRDIDSKEKIVFLLMSANKDHCVKVFKTTFYETAIIFLKYTNISPLEAKPLRF